jgi:hypothetical protein
MGAGQSQQRPSTPEPAMSPEERAQAQAEVQYLPRPCGFPIRHVGANMCQRCARNNRQPWTSVWQANQSRPKQQVAVHSQPAAHGNRLRSSNIVKRTWGGGMQMRRRSCAAGIEQCYFFFFFGKGGTPYAAGAKVFPRLCLMLMDWLPECLKTGVLRQSVQRSGCSRIRVFADKNGPRRPRIIPLCLRLQHERCPSFEACLPLLTRRNHIPSRRCLSTVWMCRCNVEQEAWPSASVFQTDALSLLAIAVQRRE